MPKVDFNMKLKDHRGLHIKQPVEGQEAITGEEWTNGKRYKMEDLTVAHLAVASLIRTVPSDKGEDYLASVKRFILCQKIAEVAENGGDGTLTLSKKNVTIMIDRVKELADEENPITTERRIPFILALDPDILEDESLVLEE